MTGPFPTAFIPKERYLSKEVFDAERERLWPRVWLHAAPADLVAEPGAFVTIRLAGTVNVLVVRGADGVLRAFHNVCQHRGRRLVDAPCGALERLRCPLHHWEWDLDGSLARVPGRMAFGPLAVDAPLPELPCESWGGQVFVHLGEPRETLSQWLGPVRAALERHGLEDFALVDQKTFEVRCNWKTVADLVNEAYHLPAIHPYLLGTVDLSSLRGTRHGPHCEHTFRYGSPSPGVDPVEITEALEGLLRDNGADPAALEGDARNAPELLRRALRAQGITELSDEELTIGRSWMIFPSLTLTVYPAMAQLHRHRPHPTDPERTSFDQLSFRRVAPGEPRPEPSIVDRVEDVDGTGKVTADDLPHLPALQAGMRSPGFEGVRLGAHELAPQHLHATLERYLAVRGSADDAEELRQPEHQR